MSTPVSFVTPEPRATKSEEFDAVRAQAKEEGLAKLEGHKGILGLYTVDELLNLEPIDSSVIVGRPEDVDEPIEDD